MNWKQPKVYAVQHKDENIRAASRSGGIFTAISDYMFEQGGVVYGSVLTDDFKAVHIRADSMKIRDRMRGSKYIQSKMGNTYRIVKRDLIEGRKVLFSGTSCQVAGLKSFLGKEYDGLVCVDIVCHGVPSPLVWEKYLEWQEKKAKGKTVRVDFRNKNDFGWRDHIETMWFDNGKTVSSSVFKNLFYGHTILRPCCYECPYKSVMHPGDITIADYWGIEKAAPEFDDNKGVSLVLVNNAIGEKVFDSVKNSIRWKGTKLEDSMQPPLKAPFLEPEGRKTFWNDFANSNFNYVAKKYGGAGVVNRMKRGLRKIKRKLVG
ncbi:Coenzyme F420 hydrogenase/dehydrogenase, beta subunit C-terminal domain [Anaerostipes faecalis]|uniref:Coenzyme F420 hydrogenase/dehydrogenase, beta subunit C-terminal domain n=1 Tax=Anaerostipes faecalis TaxID=2738446 RepID=UPI003F0D6D00